MRSPVWRLALCVALLLAYPVRSFVALAGVPVWVRAVWPLVAVAAWRWPVTSLCAFVAGAPLLPIVPQLAGWAPVSLGEFWLFALLVPAGLRVALGRRRWRAGLPAAFSLLLALATASLVVTIYPFRIVAGGTGFLLAELHAFLAGELAAASSQAHRFASIGAWLTIVDGLALLWLDPLGRGPRPAAVCSHVGDLGRCRRLCGGADSVSPSGGRAGNCFRYGCSRIRTSCGSTRPSPM